MRKIVIVAAACLLWLACGKNGTSDRFSQAWEVIEQRPDSALVILGKMDVASLTEEERAEYGLLMTMADYKTHQKDRLSDSLISSSISYYDQHGDRWHRASAYYYRGCVRYYHKQNMEAIHDYKTAEALAETLDDELLCNKIYEMLAYANYSINNKPEILRYSLKLLDSSFKMRDSMMLARSHSMVATGYSNIGQIDSAYVYVIKSLDYIDAVDPQTQSELFFNVATYYNETGNTEKAEQCLKDRVLKNANDKRGYLTMARIRKQQGKMMEAIDYATQVLETNDHKMHRRALDLLAELYSQMGDSSQAYAMQRRSKEFADSLERANKTAEIAIWQMKFDEQQRENRYLRKANWWLVITLSLVLFSIMAWWWNRRRVRRLRFRLDENIRQITQYQKEIDRLEQSGEANMQEILQLKEQITQRRERISAKLLTGASLFNRIKEKNSLAGISANDQQSLVDYFAQLRPKRWQEWESQYKDLSTAQYIFLILQDDLRYDDETIATILDIKRISVRSMRFRIKEKVS